MKKEYISPEVLVVKTCARMSLLDASPLQSPLLEEEDATVDGSGYYENQL